MHETGIDDVCEIHVKLLVSCFFYYALPIDSECFGERCLLANPSPAHIFIRLFAMA